jgi:hypothetical protein
MRDCREAKRGCWVQDDDRFVSAPRFRSLRPPALRKKRQFGGVSLILSATSPLLRFNPARYLRPGRQISRSGPRWEVGVQVDGRDRATLAQPKSSDSPGGRCSIQDSAGPRLRVSCCTMPTTINAVLRRLILQSESDLLAHAQLWTRSRYGDESVADDRQSQAVVNAPTRSTRRATAGRATKATITG